MCENQVSQDTSRPESLLASDLRAYANAGMAQVYADKLLAAAAELEAMAADAGASRPAMTDRCRQRSAC